METSKALLFVCERCRAYYVSQPDRSDLCHCESVTSGHPPGWGHARRVGEGEGVWLCGDCYDLLFAEV